MQSFEKKLKLFSNILRIRLFLCSWSDVRLLQVCSTRPRILQHLKLLWNKVEKALKIIWQKGCFGAVGPFAPSLLKKTKYFCSFAPNNLSYFWKLNFTLLLKFASAFVCEWELQRVRERKQTMLGASPSVPPNHVYLPLYTSLCTP